MLRRKIEKELLMLGAPTGRVGFVQMACALEIILHEDQVISATHDLYPMVAEQCETKATRIERNVREEIKAIWHYGIKAVWICCFITGRHTRLGIRSFCTRLPGICSKTCELDILALRASARRACFLSGQPKQEMLRAKKTPFLDNWELAPVPVSQFVVFCAQITHFFTFALDSVGNYT